MSYNRISVGVRLVLILSLAFTALTGQASTRPCEPLLDPSSPVTLRSLQERSRLRIEANHRKVAPPGFDRIEVEMRKEQVGERGPLALQQFLPAGASFVATPAPNAQDSALVNMIGGEGAFIVHLDTKFEGARTSTAAYVTLPGPKIISAGNYLIGPEYPVAQIYFHGGGTPTASGKNGLSIGEKMALENIPVMGFDMPGHGRATRHIDKFLEFKKQWDWAWQLIEEYVHPSVKLSLEGHSWGGEFMVYLHWLGQDPKYARILRRIAISPPVDISLGGDLKRKLEHELWYEENFESLRERIAPTDFDFLKNILANGKDALVPGLFTIATSLDYRTPVLSAEELKARGPLTVIVGDQDGLVYVGNEDAFQKLFGELAGDSEFLLLGPGLNFKSKDQSDLKATGHNVFDLWMAGITDQDQPTPDGRTRYLVYRKLADATIRDLGFVPPAPRPVDDAEALVEKFFQNYSLYFAFRELVETQVEFIQHETAEHKRFNRMRERLSDYAARIADIESGARKDEDDHVLKVTRDFARDLGFGDERMNKKRAMAELEMPELTPERRLLVEKFVAEVKAMEERLDQAPDAVFLADLRALEEEFRPLLDRAGVGGLDDYGPVLDALVARTDLSPKEDKLRSQLSQLHQRHAKLIKAKTGRLGAEKDRQATLIAERLGVGDARTVHRELGVDRSPERRARLQKYIAEIDAVEKRARQESHDHIQALKEAVPRRADLESIERALREKAKLDGLLNFTYRGHPALAKLAMQIEERHAEWLAASAASDGSPSIAQLKTQTEGLRVRVHSTISKRWTPLWDGEDAPTSSALDAANQAHASALASYAEFNRLYKTKMSTGMTELKEAGRLTPDEFLKLNASLSHLRDQALLARDEFMKSVEHREFIRASEAIRGHLSGARAKDAQKIALEIWGDTYPSTRVASPTSLVNRLQASEDLLESRRRQEYQLERELHELIMTYTRTADAVGVKLPYGMRRISVYEVLNQPLAQLLHQVRTDHVVREALRRTMTRWEAILAELKSEILLKGTKDEL